MPTRIFHWALAAAVVGLVITAKVGGNAMEWHFRLGYTVLALLAFRLVWGFVGGYWSRFARFVYTPSSVFRYIRGGSRPDEFHDVGHNPLGSLSVYALFVVLLLQVGSGLVSDDEIASSGPLVRFVSTETSSRLTALHTEVGQWLVIGLVALHVVAILFYVLVKRKTLVRPMITGDKDLPAGVPPSGDSWATRAAAALLFALTVWMAAWVAGLRI
ncbi:cytochrome b/b6 domain-containing protein [soil metagenome]